MSWRDKVDQADERRRQEERRRREREDEAIARENAAIDRQYERKLEKHQRRFQCHVCGKPSDGPVDKLVGERDEQRDDGSEFRTYGIYEPDWGTPTGLVRCTRCNKLTCDDDIYRGICKTCAERIQ